MKEHKIAEPGEQETRHLKDRLRHKITHHFHVWDLQSGRCLQKFTIKGDITYATVCPYGRFALVICDQFEAVMGGI